LLRSRMAAALQYREPDRVPIGELVVDWRIAEEALGMKTLGFQGFFRSSSVIDNFSAGFHMNPFVIRN